MGFEVDHTEKNEDGCESEDESAAILVLIFFDVFKGHVQRSAYIIAHGSCCFGGIASVIVLDLAG